MSDEQRIKVHVLAVEPKKMNLVQERVCQTRPVDMSCFYDIKEFFSASKENPPDILAISINFQHSSVAQFPQIFESAIGCPVIVFSEIDNSKSRTVLSACEAQYKITSTLTAHNLWMKIRHCIESEAEAKKAAVKKNKTSMSSNADQSDFFIIQMEKLKENTDMAHSLGYLLKANQRGEDDKKNQAYKPDYQSSEDNKGFVIGSNSKKVPKVSSEQGSGRGVGKVVGQGSESGSGTDASVSDLSYPIAKGARAGSESPAKQRNKKNAPIRSETDRIQEEKRENILLTLSHKVIRDIISLNGDFDPEEVLCSDSETIEMMTVKINKLKGCLMIRASSEHKLPANWFAEFRKELLRGLQDSGYESEISPYLAQISKEITSDIESIDKFSDRPQTEDPKFLFADHNYVEPALAISSEAGYLEVDPKMIKPEKTLYFDVYIHLPKNKRSVRYLKKGSVMSTQQADRLDQNPNADKLFVDPKEELQLRQFLLEISFEKHISEKSEAVKSQDSPSVDEAGSNEDDSSANNKAS